MATFVVNGAFVPGNYESLTVDSTAGGVALTAAKLIIRPTTNAPADPNRRAIEAYMTLETAQIRWTVDGTAPTTTEGHLLEIGDTLTIQGYQALAAFRAIRTGGSSGTLKITYYFR